VSELSLPLELLPEQALLSFISAQRWFGSRSGEVAALRILDRAELRGGSPALIDALVEIRHGSGGAEVYQLILGLREDGGGEGRNAGQSGSPASNQAAKQPLNQTPNHTGNPPGDQTIATAGGWSSYEAFTDPLFARELVHRLGTGAVLPAGEGRIEFCVAGGEPSAGSEPRRVRVLGLEQTNSSIVLDDELIVKVFRRIEAGVNPELEMLTFFATHGYGNVPRLRGWWSYAAPLMSASLGVVQQFMPDAVDGWSLALEELGSDPELFLRRLRRLGEVIGEMHAVLASETQDPAFAPEEASEESFALLLATIDEEIEKVFCSLPDTASVACLRGRGDEVRDLLRALSSAGSVGRRIRTHGDLHLGQLLWAGEDWFVIDFEGEPARPLHERRLKQSPLRDVAGILRSFTYASAAASILDPEIETRARAELLEGYWHSLRGTAVLPPRETAERLVRIFELEKAIYELRYELAHRPDWVAIPVAGILRLLEEPL